MEPTILIAENDWDLAELYKQFLSWCGYRALTASGGVECVWTIRNQAPSVIVASVDIKWGGADGLIEYLCDEFDQAETPFVILTGSAAEENLAALCRQPCVFGYLRKPFLMVKLLECVRAIESERRPVAQPVPRLVPQWVAAVSSRFTPDGLVCEPCVAMAR